MTFGIYTLANDVVYNQLVALLNSIETNLGKDIPVCVIAYDNRLEKVRSEIANRSQVTLWEDLEAFKRWEDFSLQVWQAHPTALKTWKERGIPGVYRIGMNRRYCAFDEQAPFEKFVYLDSDILVFSSFDRCWPLLDEYDVVVNDFQHKDPSHIYNVKSDKLFDVFPQSRIEKEIFCAGMYASRRGLINQEKRDFVVSRLQSGEAEVLYMNAPNQSVLNYLLMTTQASIYNLTLNLPPEERTGCSVTSSRFVEKDHILYDGTAPLNYLHYIGLSSKLFDQLDEGQNITFPYRDIYLYYRYLSEPEKYPKFSTPPRAYDAPPSLMTRIMRKIGLK